MDEEEELENTLIGQQEEAPAVNTEDARIGSGQPMLTADSNVVAAVPGIENIRNPSAFDLRTGYLGNIESNEPIMSAGTVERATPFQLAGQSISQGISNLGQGISSGFGVLKDVLNRDQGLFDVDRLGTASDNLLGSAMRNLTPAEDRRFTNNEPFMKTFTDTFAITRPDGTKFYPDEVTSSVETPSTLPSSAVETPSTLPSSGMTIDQLAIMKALSNQNQGMDINQQAISNALIQEPTQAPELDPTSDEAILARRAEREAQFAPRGPMGPEETRARLGGMTLNEYLNAPAGTPGVSGLRTDPQGRMISTPAPAVVNNFAPQASGGQASPAKVPDEIMSQVVRTGGQTAEFRDSNRDGIEDRQQGIFRPGELLGYDAQGNEVRAPGTQQPVNRTPAPAQPSASALSDFERESIARQIRSGGTGSFAGDSAALQARIAERDRLPGETQTERDTRIAQSRTQRSSRGGLSQADARDLAQGMARGATEGERARALQIQSRLGLGPFEPERELTDLEKREIESQIRAREAGIARSETKADFQPRLIDVGGETAIELSPGYFQRIPKDTPNKTGLQKTLENLQAD